MPAPPVTIYVTSLTSQAKVRKNIELLHRALRGFEIPYETFDLVMDEDAKRRWQRAKPPGVVVGLPGYLVGGEYIGDMDDFEYAVESGTLEAFLKQDTDHADASQTIGEAELDRLMREMTDADLDQLVGDLHVKDPSAASAPAATTATAEKSAAATGAAATSAAASPVKSVSAASPVKATSSASPVKSTSSPTSQPASAVSEAAHTSPTEVSAANQAALSSLSGSPTTSPTASQKAASPTATKAASPITPATASPSAPTNPPPTDPTSPPTDTAAPTGVLGALASAATAVSDTAAKLAHNVEETAAHATDAARDAVEAVGHNEGPAPGEKTLDDVIDETMAKEKAQAEAEDKDKAD